MPNREIPQKQNTSSPKPDVPPKFSEDTHKFQAGNLNEDEEYLAEAAEDEGQYEPGESSEKRATEADPQLKGSQVNQAKSATNWNQNEEFDDKETDFERTGRESLIDDSSQRRGKTSTH